MQQFMKTLENRSKGLRRDKYSRIDQGLLVKAFGSRVSSYGLTPVDDITDSTDLDYLYDLGISQKLPNVNIINTDYYNLVISFSTVFSIDQVTGLLTKLDINFPFSHEYPYLTLLDFGQVIYLHNGNTFFKYDGTELTEVSSDLQTLKVNSSTYGFGRVILGGFTTKENKDINRMTDHLGLNDVWWGSIGGESFLSELGEIDIDIDEKLQQQEIGFTHMPMIDTIHYISAINEENVIVYGSYNIVVLQQVIEPIITMSQVILSNMGIKDRSHVCAGKNKHLYINGNNDIYMLAPNEFGILKVNKVGGREYINEMSSPLKISYNEEHDEFYVSSNTYTLIITEYGITQLNYVVHGIVNIQGRTIPIISKTNKIGDPSWNM